MCNVKKLGVCGEIVLSDKHNFSFSIDSFPLQNFAHSPTRPQARYGREVV
jgi:hypothetical protein